MCRWRTVSLRTFFVVLTVALLALGWYANRALQQRAAVAAIRRQGGTVLYSHETNASLGAPPPRLSLRAAKWLGIDFVDHVAWVTMEGSKFDDADLKLLDALPRLSQLSLYETNIRGQSFHHVSRCRNLTFLVINETPLEDRALVEIGRMPQLTSLHLVDTKLTDAGLQHLAGLERLSDLSLSGAPITDASLAQARLPETLTVLSLGQTQIGDEGVRQLERLPRLRWLCLNDCGVSDASIESLMKMPRLRHVTLNRTRMSNAGLSRLQAALGPGCTVTPHPQGRP